MLETYFSNMLNNWIATSYSNLYNINKINYQFVSMLECAFFREKILITEK